MHDDELGGPALRVSGPGAGCVGRQASIYACAQQQLSPRAAAAATAWAASAAAVPAAVSAGAAAACTGAAGDAEVVAAVALGRAGQLERLCAPQQLVVGCGRPVSAVPAAATHTGEERGTKAGIAQVSLAEQGHIPRKPSMLQNILHYAKHHINKTSTKIAN